MTCGSCGFTPRRYRVDRVYFRLAAVFVVVKCTRERALEVAGWPGTPWTLRINRDSFFRSTNILVFPYLVDRWSFCSHWALLNICNVLILRYLSSFMVFSVMVAINHGHDYDLYRQFFVFRTLYRYAMLKKLPGIMRWVAVLNELNDTKHKSSSAAAAIESIRRHSNDNF